MSPIVSIETISKFLNLVSSTILKPQLEVKKVNADILKVQERIEKILGLKVNIVNKKNNSGKVTIEYKSLDQFELISDLLTKH